MKHGDKNKGKASKASGKKAGSAPGKASKAISASAKVKSVVAKAKSVIESKGPGKKAGADKSAGNGTARARGEGGFSNPAVGAAFKTAVKKYPNAFRKLTD